MGRVLNSALLILMKNQNRSFGADKSRFRKLSPLYGIRVGGLTAFLISDWAASQTGSQMLVDAGHHIMAWRVCEYQLHYPFQHANYLNKLHS